MPSGVPLRASSELSPPEEPPLLRRVLYGFVVYPNTLLYVSGIIIAVGTFLLVSTALEMYIRFAQDYSSKIFQLFHQDTLSLGGHRVVCPSNKAQGSV